MTVQGWLQIALYVAILTALTPVVGAYMFRVYSGERVLLTRVLGPLERIVYRLLGNDPEHRQDWKGYARTALVFSALSFIALYAILRSQPIHPFNPQDFASAPWDVSFNTAASFVSNTNWQYYGGETTMTYFSQMAGLALQNFISAAVGIAVLIAVIRGFVARSGGELGNFWADLTRTLLYILLPISVVGGLLLISQGTLQTLAPYVTFATLTGGEQTLALGPVGSQEAIKQLGTNGGGFFNVNAAMPFENPNGLTNFINMLLILAIPAGLTATFGRMAANRRLGWALYGAMTLMFVVGVGIVYAAETNGSPAQQLAGLAGSNLEGKEVRFGDAGSALWVVVTTVASCGAVNSAHDALTGIGGAVPMANMMTGEVIFGGVGSGLYGMLLFVLLAVFLAGLMVGRTPEFLGKKIEAREIKLVVMATLAVPLLALAATALALATKYGAPSIYNPGPQGFSETLYAYVSQANNNGSAFAGYSGFVQPDAGNAGSSGITFADVLGGLAMLGGRFVPMVLALAVAGSLAGKRVTPAGPGTMRTDTPTFVVLLIATILIVALLTFVPSLLLGPVVQGLSTQLF
ncbi:MAG: Potassium-transporting ATPase A chain [uncultured Solirubrobacteraceae bacterium]|uniref:Potassium-transporting ATPase potassium-binding subunit n=1 Tax=uncultured Solirubrobacteraceae bacterium TaxID=1162706 RepID=A0A6J4TSU9_9ACTN|nr:MAG: Potassium-transporting ATPase A chain [uncultured Solirubrobacteraceae bacterium]